MILLCAPVSAFGGTNELNAATRPEPYWQQRTDEQMKAAFATACKASLLDKRPILLAFSAPWCGDCQQIHALESQDALLKELREWHHLVVEVGRFDRHPELLKSFKVAKIAHWAAVRPTNCLQSVGNWPRLAEGVFEPKSGEPMTAADLASWLKRARVEG
jgi:thiol-disulfide isomerase/thioredoxin